MQENPSLFPGNEYLSQYTEELSVSAAVPSVPLKRKFGDRLFYQEQPIGADTSLLYMEEDGKKILIHGDSHKLLGHWVVSPSGLFVAYELVDPGDEEGVLCIYACGQREIIATLPHARHSKIVWSEDESHVLYTGVKTEENNSYSHCVFQYHIPNNAFSQMYDIGTLRKYDVRLIQSPNYKHIFMLRGQVHSRTMEMWRYDSLRMVFEKLDGEIPYAALVVDNNGTDVYATIYDELHPDGYIAQTQLRNSLSEAVKNAKPFITDLPTQSTIRRLYITDTYLVVHTVHGGTSNLFLYDRNGVYLKPISIPRESFVRTLVFSPGANTVSMRLSFYTKPHEIWEYNCDTNALTPLVKHDSKYEIIRREVTTDGDTISYTIIRKKEVPQKPQPTIMTAYGALKNINIPEYNGTMDPWLDQGYNYVVAHVRGGGEYGSKWSERGRGARNKKNTVDDLVKIARDLISNGYTTDDMLGLYGASAGGWLVLTAALRNPSVFQSIYAYAPVTDLLSFHKHGFGERWKTEFGDPDDAEQSPDMEMISPMQMKLPDHIPHTLLAVGNKDKRVDVDAHSRALYDRLSQTFSENVSLLEFTELGHIIPTDFQGKITYFAPILAFFGETLTKK